MNSLERFKAHISDRDVTDDEKKLWREFKVLVYNEPYETVRIQQAGKQAGLHEERVRQIVRTWSNDGLVSFSDNANLVKPTQHGLHAMGDDYE